MLDDEWLLVGEAAKRLGLSPGTIRHRIDSGLLAGIRTPRGVRLVRASDLERLRLSEGRKPAREAPGPGPVGAPPANG